MNHLSTPFLALSAIVFFSACAHDTPTATTTEAPIVASVEAPAQVGARAKTPAFTAVRAEAPAPAVAPVDAPRDGVSLLDAELSQWEVFTGKPHASRNAEARKLLGADWEPGQAGGLGDPFKLFTTSADGSGEVILDVNGRVYAGLTTLESFSNYHLSLQVKWKEAKWAPRLNKKRDSGIIYHAYGEHGAFWDVWKRSLELQIQETDTGDLYHLSGPSSVTNRTAEDVWDPAAPASAYRKRVIRSANHESPHGEWTRVDLYVLGDRAIHVVNGEVVLALKDAKNHQGRPLVAGQIQIQSEGADCAFKDIRIRPISDFPEDLRVAAVL